MLYHSLKWSLPKYVLLTDKPFVGFQVESYPYYKPYTGMETLNYYRGTPYISFEPKEFIQKLISVESPHNFFVLEWNIEIH